MELRDYLRVFRKRWRVVLLVPILTVLAAGVVNARAIPTYQASTTFFVSSQVATGTDSNAQYVGNLFSQQRVKSYASLMSSEDLADSLRDDLGSPLTSEQIAGKISATVATDTVLLSATVTDTDPKRAGDIATALDRQFPKLIDELERPAAASAGASVRAIVVQRPKAAVQVTPRTNRTFGLALLLGILLGIGLAVARELLDNSVKTSEDVLVVARTATLGAIGYDSKIVKRPLVVQDSPHAPRAEAFRQLRTNLQFVGVDQGLRSVVVTSSLPSEAKSTTACNLAITLAQSGARVLLVEGDLRRPKVADYLGIEGAVGLTNVLIGQLLAPEAIQQWGECGLDVLASGPLPPNPAELLGSVGMRDLLKAFEDSYDVVVVDSPPLLPVTDAAVLATMASGALLCVHAGKTRKDELMRAANALDAVNARTLGVLLTMVPQGRAEGYQAYGYGQYKPDATRLGLDPEAAMQAARQLTAKNNPATESTDEGRFSHGVAEQGDSLAEADPRDSSAPSNSGSLGLSRIEATSPDEPPMPSWGQSHPPSAG